VNGQKVSSLFLDVQPGTYLVHVRLFENGALMREDESTFQVVQ
jgi:hypothetical protein